MAEADEKKKAEEKEGKKEEKGGKKEEKDAKKGGKAPPKEEELSEEDLALYGPHPEHQKVVGGVIKPRVDGRLALDFALQPVEGKQDASGAI